MDLFDTSGDENGDGYPDVIGEFPDTVGIKLRKELVDDYDTNWPLTSIRRSISTLTDAGKLTKTSELRKGKYDKKEHVWKFKSQTRQDINDTHTPEERDNRF